MGGQCGSARLRVRPSDGAALGARIHAGFMGEPVQVHADLERA